MIQKRQQGYQFMQQERDAGKQVAPSEDGDKDWHTPCLCCGCTPTVHPTQLCGPCAFGDADTAGGNW